MKSSLSFAALLTIAASGTAAADPVNCTGPFRQCAIAVQATCSIDRSGQQRMTYWDHPGYTMQFERCVGGIFEASGRPNPYKTGITSSRGLTVPYTELLYPFVRDRD